MSDARLIGNWGESAAADFLIQHGYTILARRAKLRSGELDLVALDGETLVIVEVKTTRRDANAAAESVSDDKVRRLRAAAGEFCQKFGVTERTIRYDLIYVTPDSTEHRPDALSWWE